MKKKFTMKKKQIILILLLIFVFSGCRMNDSDPKQTKSVSKTSAPTNSIQESAVEDSTPQRPSFSNTFEISASDIARTIYGKDVEYFSKNVSGFNVDVFPNENYLLFCVSSEKSDFPILIYAYDQSKGGTPESSANLIQPFIDTLPSTLDIQCEAFNLGDSMRRIVYCAWIKNSNAQDFPLTLQILPDTDYFFFADIDEYLNACAEGRYNDILANVQTYIENTNPPEYDNAYTLQTILTPICKEWNNIEVQYDSVEKEATFFYSNVNCISDDIHFVPYAKTNEKYINLLMGFYDSDWLFFDEIILSSDENITISVSKKKIEDVISGGTIYEAYDASLDDKALEQLLQYSGYTLRFKGKNDDFKDYEVTSNEYEALITIAKFQNVRNILSDLLYHFQMRQL